MTTNATHTPWGWANDSDIVQIAEGVWWISTPSHGGLKLSQARWDELPATVRETMITPTFAEEYCEEPIVRLLLGIADDRDREMALMVACYFDRYSPALPYLRHYPPGLHYHAIVHRGGYGSDPIGRFDTRVEAESFVGDAELVRANGMMEVIECTGGLPHCRAEGRRT